MGMGMRSRKRSFPDTNRGKSINRGDKSRNPVCRKWYRIRDVILEDIFGGQCGGAARAATRLAFHDAGTFSLRRQRLRLPNSGADGSMLSDRSEVHRPENNGLQRIVAALQPLPKRYGVSSGDVLHVAGILAVIICPGGPPIETWIGRREARNKAPNGLLPDVNDSVPKMLARFRDMGLDTRDTMALIGAHTTATQQFVDPSQAGKSQDSTPDIWDVKFYGETLNDTTPDNVFKFASDIAFSQHPLSSRDFERFVDEQDDWDRDYSSAHERMSLLGQDRRRMTRCTEILPPAIDLGPLFIDKDGDNGQSDNEDDPTVGHEPKDSYTLNVDRTKLRAVMRKLRGYWGYE